MTEAPQDRVRRVDRRPAARAKRAAAVVLAVLLVAALGAGVVAYDMLVKPDHTIPAGTDVEFTVAKGSSTAAIAQELSDAGIIANALRFRLDARSAGLDGKLRAGAYTLTTGMSNEEVLGKLEHGPDIVYFDVPIPEGFTATRIAARFAKRAGIDEAELLALMTTGAPRFAAEHPYLDGAYRDSLEGYLFPATYRVKEGASAEAVVEMMLDKFDAEIADVDLRYAASKNLTVQDVVNIASMIEREARLDKERRLVSSVIYNRLKADMRLQLCATVLYEMPAGTTRLTYADLESDSPYNTYRHAGLPPGPISNPGAKSLQAAAHPAKTDYLYYVLTGEDGSHTFTSSYAEFERAVQHSRELTGD